MIAALKQRSTFLWCRYECFAVWLNAAKDLMKFVTQPSIMQLPNRCLTLLIAYAHWIFPPHSYGVWQGGRLWPIASHNVIGFAKQICIVYFWLWMIWHKGVHGLVDAVSFWDFPQTQKWLPGQHFVPCYMVSTTSVSLSLWKVWQFYQLIISHKINSL